MRTRPQPARKSLGTAWNLRPDTERVPAAALRVGDVVVESADSPAIIVRLTYPAYPVMIYARYVWQTEHEMDWKIGPVPDTTCSTAHDAANTDFATSPRRRTDDSHHHQEDLDGHGIRRQVASAIWKR